MKKRYYNYIGLLLVVFLAGIHTVYAQNEDSKVTVEAVVTDMDGRPIANVELFSDNEYVKTDADGKFSIPASISAFVIFKAKGYESVSLSVEELRAMEKIMLETTNYLYGKDQMVNLGFRRVYEGDVVGAVSSVNLDKLKTDKTQTFDIMNINMFNNMGLYDGSSVRNLGIEMNVSSLLTGGASSGRSMIVIDGLPRELNGLRASEIESITVLKDANAVALYGTAAINGVIAITTKRGIPFKKGADFNLRYGLATPKAMPKFLNSADYMEAYNGALVNDGLAPQWTDRDIEIYRYGDKYRYPDVDYYSNDYLKQFKSFYDMNGELFGGNQNMKYYANFGWHSENDLYNIGYGKEARDDMFNVTMSADLKINDWINTETTGRVVIHEGKTPMMATYQMIQDDLNTLYLDYWYYARTLRPNEYTPLLPMSLMKEDEPLMLGRKRDIDGLYMFGGNVNNRTNPIANLYSAGYRTVHQRALSFSNRINADFDRFIPGLSFHTNMNFDFISGWDESLVNDYQVYVPQWNDRDPNDESILGLGSFGMDSKRSTPQVLGTYLRRRFSASAQLQYDRKFEEHHLTGTLLGFADVFKRSGDYQGSKLAHLGLQLGYAYDKRYMIDFSGAVVNSTKLPVGNRVGLSPSLGLAWVISNEDFMSDADWIDYLKIRASAGNIKSDMPIGSFYLYSELYETSTGHYWLESLSRQAIRSTRGVSPTLSYVNRNDLNFGFESAFLNKSLELKANGFISYYKGLPQQDLSKYPNFMAGWLPWVNINDTKYTGFELGLNYIKSMNDWSLFAGVNMLYSNSVKTKVSESAAYDYLKQQGRPVDAIFGLEANGYFNSADEIASAPTQLFGTVVPGDLKYKNQNDDYVVDDNDRVYIGRSLSPLSFSLNLALTYKNFGLMVYGNARSGGNGVKSNDYYWVDGNKKYSEPVRGAWTPETASSATYPRLTTGASLNNNRVSSYWLYKTDYLAIDRVQLTFRMPESLSKKAFMKNWEWFVYVTDPILFAANKDIMELSINSPYFRSAVLGLNVSF